MDFVDFCVAIDSVVWDVVVIISLFWSYERRTGELETKDICNNRRLDPWNRKQVTEALCHWNGLHFNGPQIFLPDNAFNSEKEYYYSYFYTDIILVFDAYSIGSGGGSTVNEYYYGRIICWGAYYFRVWTKSNKIVDYQWLVLEYY